MPSELLQQAQSTRLPLKLARPHLPQAYRRQRLQRQLRETLTHSAAWIVGAPGSGKTVLTSTYVEASRRPCIWYQLDSRDRYPATLFHYLRRAVQAATPQQVRQLPYLTPEYLAGLDAYARNFFERFFELIKPNSILVFDNCQVLPDDSITATLLATGLEQVPDSVDVILISRSPPGTAFARRLVCESIAIIDDSALTLDVAEARAIALKRFGKRLTPLRVDKLHHQVRGWAAGFTLLLEQTDPQGPPLPTMAASAVEPLFDYFSAEVLSGVAPKTLEILMQSAWLPRMPAALLARQCEDPKATVRVAELCRLNYFTSRNVGAQPAYEYHPLFRDCLLRRARECWSLERLDTVRRRAARLLIEDQQSEDALELLVALEDWAQVANLLASHAATWLTEGRIQLIESALEAMPNSEIEPRPGLLYWQASCRLPFDPVTARALFAAALEGFESADDARGCFCAWSGVVDCFVYEWGDFTALDHWIERFEQLRERYPCFPDAEAEARAVIGIFTALSYRQPQHPDLPDWTRRMHRLVEQNESLRLLAGSRLVPYYVWWSGDLARASSITALLQPQAERVAVEPLIGVVWCAIRAMELWMRSDTQGCVAMAEHGLELAARSGVHIWDFMLLAQATWGQLTAGDLEATDALLTRMSAVLQPTRLLDACHYHYQVFTAAMHRGDAVTMYEHAESALQLARRAGVPWAQGTVLPALARVLELRGETVAADALVAEAGDLAKASHSGTIAYTVLLAQTEFARGRGQRRKMLSALREFMAVCRVHDFTNSSLWDSGTMAELCVIALEHDIETEFVQRLIRVRQLAPEQPPVHLRNWPWSLRITTLGHFEVRKDEMPLCCEGKSQKRPLALLKAIVALGPREVPEARLADALWPDAEGDAAQQALATTLHRLRRLIGVEAVQRQGGRVGLDPARCWVDLWACERHLDAVEDALPDNAKPALAALRPALALYRGPFLDGDEEAPWVLPARERLRNRLLRAVTATGDALHASGDNHAASVCYEQALALDELAEACYRGLMRCHLDGGRHAEGLVVYRRCAELLKQVLGCAPSTATEALRRELTRH